MLAALLPVMSSSLTPEEAASGNEAERQLWNAVDRLDEKHRLPIILRYTYDLSASEIAETLGISEGTVYSRLHYAREKIQQLLAQDETFWSMREGTRQ